MDQLHYPLILRRNNVFQQRGFGDQRVKTRRGAARDQKTKAVDQTFRLDTQITDRASHEPPQRA